MRRKPATTTDFQRFYHAKVGLGEGCGCAERVIDLHEFDRLAGRPRLRLPMLPRRGAWRRFLNKAGLTRRPKA
ncbi:hypothetical protein [Sulfitobacter sabulilitoris]|uniref:Uncharacterized protein n=1 Tax=Sulfitobacter sabulilitoris TaxID=2562655 RepID=A0A5S3PGR2_9RHOB|nr:hypothetical protein [Sulfitobacter sabulilitoris]TMM50832.1 hypothetical protein FDT80_16380 [Sulfitobacter sabulilitoris]